jgi:3-deoxy-D-manno-octulosonate 8-phosphate phosphatase (KDO 8-P phosphatase)
MRSSLEKAAEAVELVVFDVDGVLTPGTVLLGPTGEWRQFDIHDEHGIKVAVRAGLKIALLTGRESEVVARWGAELGVHEIRQGAKRKAPVMKQLLKEMDVPGDRVCYVGDDLVDIPAMRLTRLPVAVANAVAEVKEAALWTTESPGGAGAAREVVEYILKARGLWSNIMKRYIGEESKYD